MSRWIETELKLLLPDASASRRVRDALGAGPVVAQENHFFDGANGVLAAARIAVRLRLEDGRRWLTVKGDELARPGNAVSRRIELETEMPQAEFEAALAKSLDLVPWIPRLAAQAPGDSRSPELLRLLDVLRAAGRDGPLVRTDGFSNRRERLRLELSDELGTFEVELDLDETHFPGDRIDYEIEVELDAPSGAHEPRRLDPDRVERAVLGWLRTLADVAVVPAPSKLSRLRASGGRPA